MRPGLFRRFRSRATALARSTAGNAAVEFGIAAPVLVTIVAGIADLGTMATSKSTLDAAVRAGAQYARFDPTATGAITSVVTNYTNFVPSVTVVVSPVSCECDDGSAVDCSTGTCASGQVHSYVTVSATQSFSAILPLTSVGLAPSLTASVTMRTQ